jgi:translation initiation factor 4G
MDDLKDTPNAGLDITQTSLDAALECKEPEREAIISIISILYKNGKLTSDDIGTAFADIMEFIDSFVVDSPRALEYTADMMAEFLHIKALDVNWLCRTAKTIVDEMIPGVFTECIKSVIKRYSVDEAKMHFGPATDAIVALLTAEKWEDISAQTGLK